MYTGLLHTHSLLRWVVLILLLFAIIRSISGWTGKKPFTSLDNKLGLFSMIGVHLQLVIGLILYFISPWVESGLADMGAAMKDSTLRFWTVEHAIGMLIGIALITIGRVKAKKATEDVKKHKHTAIFFAIGVIIILATIPWAERGLY